MGKFFIILLTVLLKLGYDKMSDNGDNLEIYVYVALLVISHLMTKCVFHVLEVAIDTMFLSVLDDSERNDGSELKPYYMSDKLRKLVLKEYNVSYA